MAIVVPSGWLAAQSHDTQFWVLLACAATAGVGGGNFSSSMANISFFYPEGRKGFALGLNAAGGNLGVAVDPAARAAGDHRRRPGRGREAARARGAPGLRRADVDPVHRRSPRSAPGCTWTASPQAKADKRSYVEALEQRQTWIMSLLYIGTFGSFIGFSFTLPLVIRNTFPEFLAQHPFIATYLAGLGFVGALIGSVSRPFGGWLSDRLGGARVTLAVFIGMGVAPIVAIAGVDSRSFAVFFAAYMVVFLLSGMGNGSTYRMIPSIFAALGRRRRRAMTATPRGIQAPGRGGHRHRRGDRRLRRLPDPGRAAPGLAVGPAAVKAAETPAEKVAVAQANADWSIPALWVFVGAYVVFAGVTWFVYLRRQLRRSSGSRASRTKPSDRAPRPSATRVSSPVDAGRVQRAGCGYRRRGARGRRAGTRGRAGAVLESMKMEHEVVPDGGERARSTSRSATRSPRASHCRAGPRGPTAAARAGHGRP